MNKIYLILFILSGLTIKAQLKEIVELKNIGSRYDSMLIAYQKKAKDSLSHLKKDLRNEIMAAEEAKIFERQKEEERNQLAKIKSKELEIENLKKPEKFARCKSAEDFEMPSLANRSKYQSTLSKKKADDSTGKDHLSSLVLFQVTADGFIKNVVASGENRQFNTDLEITLYKLEKLTPRCINGFAKTERFRLPVKINFK